jgi:hypothetical protein
MESFSIAWRLLLLASLFVFPQLLGVLLYFRMHRAPRWLAVIAAAIAPAVFFIFVAPIFLFAGLREASAGGPSCGMPAFGAILLLYAGATINLVLGVVMQAVLSAGRRHRKVVIDPQQ